MFPLFSVKTKLYLQETILVHTGIIFFRKGEYLVFANILSSAQVLHTFTDLRLINFQSLFYVSFFFHHYYTLPPVNFGQISEILTKLFVGHVYQQMLSSLGNLAGEALNDLFTIKILSNFKRKAFLKSILSKVANKLYGKHFIIIKQISCKCVVEVAGLNSYVNKYQVSYIYMYMTNKTVKLKSREINIYLLI